MTDSSDDNGASASVNQQNAAQNTPETLDSPTTETIEEQPDLPDDLIVESMPDTWKYRTGDEITFEGLVITLDGKDVTSKVDLDVEEGAEWPPKTKLVEVVATYTDAAGEDHKGSFVIKRKMRKWPIVTLVVLLLIAGVIAGLIISDPWGDPKAKKGYYEGKPQEEIERDLSEEVDWYSMQMSCAPYVVMSPGSTQAKGINIENIEANHCDQVITITLKGTDEKLYESRAISPGYYIEDVDFARSFDEGVYIATVEFQGYEQNARLGGDGQIWGHDKFGAPSRLEILLIVTDDQEVAQATATYYLQTGKAKDE